MKCSLSNRKFFWAEYKHFLLTILKICYLSHIHIAFTCVCVLNCSIMSNSLWPHGLQFATLLCPWGFSRQEYWSQLPCPPLGHLPNPGIEPRSPALQVGSLLPELPGKSKKTGVGSLSFWRGSSQPRNWTGVSCVAGVFFTSWATREAHFFYIPFHLLAFGYIFKIFILLW